MLVLFANCEWRHLFVTVPLKLASSFLHLKDLRRYRLAGRLTRVPALGRKNTERDPISTACAAVDPLPANLNSAEGLALAKTGDFDALIVNRMLPDGDGLPRKRECLGPFNAEPQQGVQAAAKKAENLSGTRVELVLDPLDIGGREQQRVHVPVNVWRTLRASSLPSGSPCRERLACSGFLCRTNPP